MANVIPARPRSFQHRRSIAVVASAYHQEYMEGLLMHFQKELDQIAPHTEVHIHHVPGCFEIPVLVQEVAMRGGVDAIVAFGVLLEGQTAHATLISTAVTNAIMDCTLRYRIPVVHEVLVVADSAQAQARCLQPELNRGIEAARAAVRIIEALAEFKG